MGVLCNALSVIINALQIILSFSNLWHLHIATGKNEIVGVRNKTNKAEQKCFLQKCLLMSVVQLLISSAAVDGTEVSPHAEVCGHFL